MAIGAAVGLEVGAAVGEAVGAKVGEAVGAAVGEAVGAKVGEAVGAAVGEAVGAAVGESVTKTPAITPAWARATRAQRRFFFASMFGRLRSCSEMKRRGGGERGDGGGMFVQYC